MPEYTWTGSLRSAVVYCGLVKLLVAAVDTSSYIANKTYLEACWLVFDTHSYHELVCASDIARHKRRRNGVGQLVIPPEAAVHLDLLASFRETQ